MTHDVVIIGAGLAGLTAAIHLKRKLPACSVMVLERRAFPYPDAIHKVGESTVEVGAHYFSEVLGLRDYLQTSQLRKLGIRLFFSSETNERIEQRVEMGSDTHFFVPTYQIDRGRFENFLREEATALGAQIVQEARVSDVKLLQSEDVHTVYYRCADGVKEASCRWVVDASGRAAVLKKQERLQQPSEHDSNAVWFRIKGQLNLDDWCDDKDWRDGHEGMYSRWYSTNHLTGEGYWVWIIPLVSGYTSIGVVTDPKVHSLSRFRSFENTMEWFQEYEPQCARMLQPYRDAVADFLAIKHYAHKCTRVLSPDRWAITGDAGVFIDPLYSPGSDFIAIQNTFIVDLITRDLAGERFSGRSEVYNDIYQQISEGFLKSYYDQYRVLGNPRIMPFKVVWDYLVYWGFLGFIIIQDRLCDLNSIKEIEEAVSLVYEQNERMQRLFRESHPVDNDPVLPGMIDIRRIEFLVELNRGLTAPHDNVSFRATLRRNMELIHTVYRSLDTCVRSRRGTWSSTTEFEALCNSLPLPPLETTIAA